MSRDFLRFQRRRAIDYDFLKLPYLLQDLPEIEVPHEENFNFKCVDRRNIVMRDGILFVTPPEHGMLRTRCVRVCRGVQWGSRGKRCMAARHECLPKI